MPKLMDYLPELYRDIHDFIELTETKDVELERLGHAMERLLDDQFVVTSDERAIRRREKMLGIQPDPTTETLDFRKKRIINRYSTKPPFTLRYLQERLEFLVGEGRAVTNVDVQLFLLKVTASIEDALIFKEVERTVKAIKPANLIYLQETAVEDEVCLEEHISMWSLARDMGLSTTWRLGRTPFATVGPEVIIV